MGTPHSHQLRSSWVAAVPHQLRSSWVAASTPTPPTPPCIPPPLRGGGGRRWGGRASISDRDGCIHVLATWTLRAGGGSPNLLPPDPPSCITPTFVGGLHEEGSVEGGEVTQGGVGAPLGGGGDA
nr:hypothetical protein [Morchella crassipes]